MKIQARCVLSFILTIASLLFYTTPKNVLAEEKLPDKRESKCRELSRFGLPSNNVRVLCKSDFVVGYSDKRKLPLWTIERLTRFDIPISTGNERGTFREDPTLPAAVRATLDDYAGSGFDRGHLVAAGNHVNNQTAYEDTFLLSNVAPQIGIGFNRGLWRSLEEYVRQLGQCTDDLFVFTGVYFSDDRGQSATVGTNRVHVPSVFFKILYLPDEDVAIAFSAGNEKHSTADFDHLLIPIDELELRSGYNFFSMLPKSRQAAIEKTIIKSRWSFNVVNSSCSIKTTHPPHVYQ